MRHYSFLDKAIQKLDSVLQTVSDVPVSPARMNPANNLSEPYLSAEEKRKSQGFMRINHAGEVCAQALYEGQAFVARSQKIRHELLHVAEEEKDHLAWCQERLKELDSYTSYLNVFWYGGSFLIGVLASLSGDKVSLGFLSETERQVEQHITEHLEQLPSGDVKSRRILEQMRLDEAQHAQTAEDLGASQLPSPLKTLMRGISQVMKVTAYWI